MKGIGCSLQAVLVLQATQNGSRHEVAMGSKGITGDRGTGRSSEEPISSATHGDLDGWDEPIMGLPDHSQREAVENSNYNWPDRVLADYAA